MTFPAYLKAICISVTCGLYLKYPRNSYYLNCHRCIASQQFSAVAIRRVSKETIMCMSMELGRYGTIYFNNKRDLTVPLGNIG